MDDEFDPDVDFESEPKFLVAKKRPLWLIVGAFFELVSNVFRAFSGFFDVAADASLQTFAFKNEREKFIQRASQEIEMITSGNYDATTTESSGRFGSGGAE